MTSPDSSTSSNASGSPVKSATRVLDLLELLAATPGGLRVTDVARKLAIPKSSASALLSTLQGRGYVQAHQDGYCLALRYRGGWVGGQNGALLRAAHTAMTQLVQQTGESAFLGVLTADWEVRYIERVISASPLRYEADVGAIRPAFCTSIGHILLSGQDENAVSAYLRRGPLPRVTPCTVTSPAAIEKMVAQARQRGYAPMADSHALGASGVSAPILDTGGATIAALAVIAPTQRFDAQRESIMAAVIQAAGEITKELGRQ